MSRVAVIGTGLLGSGFVEGMLARGGSEIVVWNRTRAKAEPLGGAGMAGLGREMRQNAMVER